jgi:hypothetical protein
MATVETVFEEIKVMGKDLVAKVQDLIHEGTIRRIIIKNEAGHTIVELPLTLAAIGAIAAPILAAVGAIAAMVTNCTLVVEKTVPHTAEQDKKQTSV